MAAKAHVLSVSTFRDNAERRRYELDAPEGQSIADYRDLAGVRVIMHVETPPQARGRGYATKLMNHVVDHARAAKLPLRASCAFAVAYFRRHPEQGDVLA